MSFFMFVTAMLSLCLLAESVRAAGSEDLTEVNFGNYGIQGCGDRTTSVLYLLHVLIDQAVQPAIDDALLNPTSAAYNTFFKDIYYAEQVLKVLTGITGGRTRSFPDPNPLDFRGGMNHFRAPMFICVDGPKQYVSSKLNCPSTDNKKKYMFCTQYE